MSKPAVLETLDTQQVTKAVTDALPRVEILTDAKKGKERLSKAIRAFGLRARAWWRNLPSDSARAAVPVSAALLVASFVTGLVVRYARRH